MKIRRITRSWLRNNGACYSDEQIAALVPEEGVTLQQVLETDRIPDGDKIWVATREKLLPETIMVAWLAGIVERALGRLKNPDPRSLAVIPMLRRIASGEEVGQEERGQIRNEAHYATCYAATCYAANYAACYAADAYHPVCCGQAYSGSNMAVGYLGV